MKKVKDITEVIQERTSELKGLVPQVSKVYEFPGHPCISTVTVTPVAGDNFTVSILNKANEPVTPMDLWGDEVTSLLEGAFTAEDKVGVLPLEGAVHFLNGVADAEMEAVGEALVVRAANLVPLNPVDGTASPAYHGSGGPCRLPQGVETLGPIPKSGPVVLRIDGRQVLGRIIGRGPEILAVQLDDPPTEDYEQHLPAVIPGGSDFLGVLGNLVAVALMARLARAEWAQKRVSDQHGGSNPEMGGDGGGTTVSDDPQCFEGRVVVWMDDELEAKLRGRAR